MRLSVAIIAAVSDFLYLARIFGKLILFIQLLKSIFKTILRKKLKLNLMDVKGVFHQTWTGNAKMVKFNLGVLVI